MINKVASIPKVKLIECPRDAMQGLDYFIPTEQKIRYLNALLDVGFDTIDCGSFVSPKAIPQMADTADVIRRLNWSPEKSALLVIVANRRGAQEAVAYEQIQYVGFPFSISETFQLRNTNATCEASVGRVEEIQNLCHNHGKTLVVYLSMAFGNPFGDPWHEEMLLQWLEKLKQLEVTHFSLADTVGLADAERIRQVLQKVLPYASDLEIGLHLHTTPDTWKEKIEAAWACGCFRYDGALRGYGGCPMASDRLVGNMPMENLIAFFENQQIPTGVDREHLAYALQLAAEIFQPAHA
ncbi:MAG: hydroxymethylglutaryl-CoA lyase [Chitinophagales bacterium]|nr:hydroxymethylglutaryl-CoA lyase [Chitinophagales bacterium]MDW8428768.1 hydroxymethylglutaryl-CoA lyase [Chitinophagales bacterium]